VNVAGSMDDILLKANHNVWSDVKPVNVAGSMDDI
jgi:hypothetical protein